jgi:hypothetical protein
MSSVKRTSADAEKNRVEGGTLYLVATPIGNLGDLSERAVKVLGEVDFIAAEDTRNSMRLLSHLEIHKPMVSYFEHNKRERGEQIAERLEAGESCALITKEAARALKTVSNDLFVQGITQQQFENRMILRNAMVCNGFLPMDCE